MLTGPDTEELELRIGISSGPVTAGVLKGDRARFQVSVNLMDWLIDFLQRKGLRSSVALSQLFGDTVNFARCLEG